MSRNIDIVEPFLIDVLGLYNLFLPNWFESELAAEFCSHFLDICEGMVKLCCDLDPSVDNFGRVKTYLTHLPAGSGYRDSVHYSQSMASGRFARYDYGEDVNK